MTAQERMQFVSLVARRQRYRRMATEEENPGAGTAKVQLDSPPPICPTNSDGVQRTVLSRRASRRAEATVTRDESFGAVNCSVRSSLR